MTRKSLSALEEWGRRITSGYRGVNIKDLTNSWRNGLAFCAIIHHFRPDLIDYDSLSSENIYENNQLAFTIAERHFQIPALLDAEDMVKDMEPDKCSIAVYLSEYYKFFELKQIPRANLTIPSQQQQPQPSSTKIQ